MSALPPGLMNFALIRGQGRYGSNAGGADGPPLPKQPRRHSPLLPPAAAAPGRAAWAWDNSRKAEMASMTDAQTPLSGSQYEILAGDYQATVTELGAGLRQLRHRGVPLITEYPADVLPPAAAGQLLCPWPNRVDGGHYAVNGVHYQLDLSEPGQPERDPRPDPVVGLDGRRAQCHAGQPAASCCSATRGIRSAWKWRPATSWTRAGLQVSIGAHNIGSAAAPYGTGSHPYLAAGPGPVDSWELTLPAARWQPGGDRGIPAGRPRT